MHHSYLRERFVLLLDDVVKVTLQLPMFLKQCTVHLFQRFLLIEDLTSFRLNSVVMVVPEGMSGKR